MAYPVNSGPSKYDTTNVSVYLVNRYPSSASLIPRANPSAHRLVRRTCRHQARRLQIEGAPSNLSARSVLTGRAGQRDNVPLPAFRPHSARIFLYAFDDGISGLD